MAESLTFKLNDKGSGVRDYQHALNRWVTKWKFPALDEDGILGPLTWVWHKRVAYALGIASSDLKHGVSPHCRRVVRDPRERTRVELANATARKRWLKKLKDKAKAQVNLSPNRTFLVRNQSSRGGVRPRIIVLHTTEAHNAAGMTDINSIINWFNNSAAQSSAHIVNDGEGNDARLVLDEKKAWTQAAYNGQALSIEQMGFANTTRGQWMTNYQRQLDNTAAWVAYWSKKWGIPLVHSTTHGVCQHKDLGAAGGGHFDCGPGYPFDYVLRKAKEFLHG